jgi:allantoicase
MIVVPFAELIDLASEKVGGKALAANDEFFAPKDSLLRVPPPIFVPHQYTENGKWMDGWETRRRRSPGFDWCVIKLGIPGTIRGVNVDTSFFTGNYPEFCSIEACESESDPGAGTKWTEILPKSPLQGGSLNLFAIANPARFTHVRLNIFPDGGVARLRVHGEARPSWAKFANTKEPVDLAAAENGGVVVTCNDMFFGPKDNLILPGRALTMGDGWETRRKRRPGFDWIVVRLGRPGTVEKIEVDTNHFKGNFPESCMIEGCSASDAGAEDFLNMKDLGWREILPRTKLSAHTRHYFEKELSTSAGRITHVRLNIYPDGGVSRLRIYGTADASS